MTVATKSFFQTLADLLLEEALCQSKEEAEAIVDALGISEEDETRVWNDTSLLISNLQDHLGVTEDVAISIVSECRRKLGHEEDGDSISTSSNEDAELLEENDENDGDDNDDDSYVGIGACELCEREDRKLTRHHMIPKSTYKRIEPLVIKGVMKSLKGSKENRGIVDEDEGLAQLIPSVIETVSTLGKSIGNKKNFQLTEYTKRKSQEMKILQKSVRLILKRQTTDICRQCHSVVHRAHDNMTLALHYNTVDRILEDESIYKFCRWTNKQKK